MATDEIVQLVTDVHTKLSSIHAGLVNGAYGAGTPIPFTIGLRGWAFQDDCPLIMYRLGRLEIVEPQMVGGSLTGHIATLDQELNVRIWGADRQSVYDLLRDWYRAMRAVVLGPNMPDKGLWRWITEDYDWLVKGEAIETEPGRPLIVSLPVSDIASSSVVVTAFGENVSIADPVTGHTTLA